MKKLIIAFIIALIDASTAWAGWPVDFHNTYVSKGIDQAVVDALKEGKNPKAIIAEGITIAGIHMPNLIKALYCAGANRQDIREAAEQYNISEVILAEGVKKSVSECAEQIADSQAYTTMPNSNFNTPNASSRHGSYASPSRP